MEEYLIVPEQEFKFNAWHEKSKKKFEMKGKFSGIIEGHIVYYDEPDCIMRQSRTRIVMTVSTDNVKVKENKK